MDEKSRGRPKTSNDDRKKRLGEALRANLRRRKAPEAGNRPESGLEQAGNTKPASKPRG
jgi:hypothetical protein